MAEQSEDRDPGDQPAPGGNNESAKNTPLVGMAVMVGVVLLAAGAGFGIRKLLFSGPAQVQASQDASPAEDQIPIDDPNAASGQEYTYIKLDPTTTTLDGPRMSRYFRVTISLAVRREDERDAAKRIEAKTPELRNWLNLYLAGQTLDNVRGEKNLNRLRREIHDAMNEQLWPNAKGLISQVLFEDVNVQ